MDDEANVTKVCEICKLKDTDKLNYGEWLTSDDCTIHYFCAVSLKLYSEYNVSIHEITPALHFVSTILVIVIQLFTKWR